MWTFQPLGKAYTRIAWRVAWVFMLVWLFFSIALGRVVDWNKWLTLVAITAGGFGLDRSLERRGAAGGGLLLYFLGALCITGWFALDRDGLVARLSSGVLGYGILAYLCVFGASGLFGLYGVVVTLPVALAFVWPMSQDPSWIFAALLIGVGAFLGAELHRLNRRLEDANVRLERMAFTDPLTLLGNRQALSRHFETHSKGAALCVTVWDLDDLKRINDRLGHQVGDLYIQRFAEVLRSSETEGSRFFRTGGDEFVGLHPSGVGRSVLERVRARFPTVSAGWSEIEGDQLEAALARADELLYTEKARNKLRSSEERRVLSLEQLERAMKN